MKAEEISYYIINRKFPFIEKFQRNDEKLNKFQIALKQSRLANLSKQTSLRLFEISNFLNLIFVVFSIFLGVQSMFVLTFIFTSPEGRDKSFLELDGNQIIGYNQLWKPSTIVYMGNLFLFNLFLSYLVLNLPTISKIKPNLNVHYNKMILNIKLNFLLAISFVSFMVLGSISLVSDERINGFEPIGDLGVPIIISIICGLIGLYMLILLKKETWVDQNNNKSKVTTRLIIYFSNFVVIAFSLILMVYLALVVNSDFDKIDTLSTNSHSIPLDLTVLNLASLISFVLFFLIFILSSFINHSRLKNRLYKFMLIQILFQSALVLLYSVLEYYFIITYNDYTSSIGSSLLIATSNLTQGMIKYFGSIIVNILLLRISK